MDLLDKPIINYDQESGNASWTVRHAVEGVQIFGGIGSGKTSGSGRFLALKYLSNGFGGLVLTAKPDEKKSWIEYCALAGRSNDLIVIEPEGKYSFNFLEYESTRSLTNEAITDNIVEVLKTVIRAGEDANTSGGGDGNFWEGALDRLIFNIIDLCKIAYGSLSVQQMYDIVQSLPKPEEPAKKDAEEENKESKAFNIAYRLAHKNVIAKVKAWFDALPTNRQDLLKQDDALYNIEILEAVPEARLMKFLHEFFFDNFKGLSQKTRSIIEFIFSGFLFRLLREPVYTLFCKNKSNVVPEDSIKGKIILINLPVKLFHKVGRDCQILFKYIWQRAMEKRDFNKTSRPVFLWADEAQNFLHEHDAEYQATARSSGISTVYITQNLPNYYASMGGQKAEYRVKSFLGTLGTKIFHANADIETNKYASELIGDVFYYDPSRSMTMGEKVSTTESVSMKLDKHLRPEEFVCLKTGSANNRYLVEGYIHRQGDNIFNRKSFMKMSFNQNFVP